MNKHHLEIVVVKWLKQHFGNLIPKTIENYPNSIYYVNDNNQDLMEYDKKTERVYIHYDHIWSKIESLFHLNYGETQSIMKVWAEEDYKLGGVTPRRIPYNHWNQVEEDYKLGGVTPISSNIEKTKWWKRLTNK